LTPRRVPCNLWLAIIAKWVKTTWSPRGCDPGGFAFLAHSMPNRVVFLVDGFNLYHSLRSAERLLRKPTRWLDLRALCDSYLYILGGGATLDAVYYFSAYAHHREAVSPGAVRRHQAYVAAIASTGVIPQLGQFKCKDLRCPSCGSGVRRYEEKETDVAVAAKLLELVVTGACDTAVIVSGDTDLIPAIRTARRLRPDKKLCVAFPHGRANDAFRGEAHMCFKIRATQYARFQLPDPVVLPDGQTITKPASW